MAGIVEVRNKKDYITWRIKKDRGKLMLLDFYDASKRLDENLSGLAATEQDAKRIIEEASSYVFENNEEE